MAKKKQTTSKRIKIVEKTAQLEKEFEALNIQRSTPAFAQIAKKVKTTDEITNDTLTILLWIQYSYAVLDRARETPFCKNLIKQQIGILERELDKNNNIKEVKDVYNLFTKEDYLGKMFDNLGYHEAFFKKLSMMNPGYLEFYMKEFVENFELPVDALSIPKTNSDEK